MEEESLSRLLGQRHASHTGVAHLLSTLESTRASSSSAQRKHIRFGALLRLLDEKIDLLEDLDVQIQLAVSHDAMESEILTSTQYLNELLKQRSNFKAYYDGLKPLLHVADDAVSITSAGSRRIQPSTCLQVPSPLSSTLCNTATSTTPTGDATVAVIRASNESTLDASALIHPSIPNPASDPTLGCVDQFSSTLLNAAEDSVSSDSSLPEVILPLDEGFQHSSSIALISRTPDLCVIKDDNHPSLPNLPTERAADSSPLLLRSKPISRFDNYDDHHSDSSYNALIQPTEAHQIALLVYPIGLPSLSGDPTALRFHPYRNPAVRPAKPPPWLRGS